MDHMHGSEYQNSVSEINVFKCKAIQRELATINQFMSSVIDQATRVYVFKSHAHIPDKSELINWIMVNASDRIDYLKLNFLEYDRKQVINSVDTSEGIFVLNLNERISVEFKKRFKISIRDTKEFGDDCISSNLFVDNPLYDQYDFVFVDKEKMLLLTSIHDMNYFVSEEVLK